MNSREDKSRAENPHSGRQTAQSGSQEPERILSEVEIALHEIWHGLNRLESALAEGGSPDIRYEDGWTAYMMAARWSGAAELLGEAGADTSGHFDAVLMRAIDTSDLKLGEDALKNGANPNRRFSSFSIIAYAATQGSNELVRAMIAQGAKVESEMLFAVCCGETADFKVSSVEEEMAYADVVAALLEAGADPFVTNCEGKTPLEAIAGNRLNLIEAVLIKAQEERTKA